MENIRGPGPFWTAGARSLAPASPHLHGTEHIEKFTELLQNCLVLQLEFPEIKLKCAMLVIPIK
jgi:hypothetical protein